MLCDDCKKRPAVVHLTKMVNNEKYEKNLCEQCAKETGEAQIAFQPKYSIHNLLAGLLNFEPGTGAALTKNQGVMPVCDNCGMSYTEFSRSGRLGCAMCYTHFSQQLEPLLRRVQGGTQHAGKVPGRTGGTLMLKNKIQQLRQDLQKYVSNEEFEKAALVRDEIKQLEKDLNEKGGE
ncbi:MAG: UvrB/UvrC motif-containing protein [Bacillota bacterium]|nr:hypothetical protein [Bacillota bacterium]HWR55212.1 UvrB/UvrC motif-containing protein [Negativicutes bacterium]